MLTHIWRSFGDIGLNKKTNIMQTENSKNQLGLNGFPLNISFSDNEISDDLKIIDFMEKVGADESLITLHSNFFMKGPVRLEMKNGKLKIIVSEFIDARNKNWMPVNDWEQYTHHSYTRIHNLLIDLPEENYRISRQLIIPEKSYLKVVLSKKVAA